MVIYYKCKKESSEITSFILYMGEGMNFKILNDNINFQMNLLN